MQESGEEAADLVKENIKLQKMLHLAYPLPKSIDKSLLRFLLFQLDGDGLPGIVDDISHLDSIDPSTGYNRDT